MEVKEKRIAELTAASSVNPADQEMNEYYVECAQDCVVRSLMVIESMLLLRADLTLQVMQQLGCFQRVAPWVSPHN